MFDYSQGRPAERGYVSDHVVCPAQELERFYDLRPVDNLSLSKFSHCPILLPFGVEGGRGRAGADNISFWRCIARSKEGVTPFETSWGGRRARLQYGARKRRKDPFPRTNERTTEKKDCPSSASAARARRSALKVGQWRARPCPERTKRRNKESGMALGRKTRGQWPQRHAATKR